jgi:hypothetical protein
MFRKDLSAPDMPLQYSWTRWDRQTQIVLEFAQSESEQVRLFHLLDSVPKLGDL